jgi:potassium efflux system protein
MTCWAVGHPAQPAADCGLMWPMCRDSWRDKESHNMRLITVTVLAIIPLALMVLTATGYFYTTLRLAGRWIETVIW